MKAQIPDNEKRLQEKILAHRVPFEEQAWDAMDALLDGETGKKAPAEPPAPQETPAPANKSRKFFILLFLLSAVAVFSAKMGLNLLENRKSAPISSALSTSENSAAETTSPISLSTSETTTAEEPETNNSAENTTPKSGQKTNKAGSSTQGSSTFDEKEGSIGKRPVESNQRWVVGPAKPAKAASGHPAGITGPRLPKPTSSGSDQTTNAFQSEVAGVTDQRLPNPTNASQSTVTGETSTGLPAGDSMLAAAPLMSIDNLAFLPLLPLDSLYKARELPEAATAPEKNKTRRTWQRGWLFGGNLTMVDYQTGRMNLMPVVGYHAGFAWRGGMIETALQLKGTHGYNEKTRFEFTAPGGSQEIDMTFNNVLFVETPIVYKKTFSADKRHSWLAGVRPALVFPVFNWASYSTFSSGNTSLSAGNVIQLHDGVRWFDLGLTAGWQWRFDDRWALDVRYTQGLFDLTHDNFFNNTNTVLNSDFQLTLRHYVSSFKK